MLETAHTAIQWLSVTFKHYKVTSKVCVIYEDGGMYYIVGTGSGNHVVTDIGH